MNQETRTVPEDLIRRCEELRPGDPRIRSHLEKGTFNGVMWAYSHTASIVSINNSKVLKITAAEVLQVLRDGHDPTALREKAETMVKVEEVCRDLNRILDSFPIPAPKAVVIR